MSDWETLPYGPRPALNGKYPNPEVMADWRWLFDQIEARRLDDFRGKFVAAYNRQFVGADSDDRRLRATVASAQQIDPDKIVIFFLDDVLTI